MVLQRGDLRIDTVSLKVWLGDELLRMTPTEYRILLCLATADGRPMQALEIVERGFDAESTKTAAEIPVCQPTARQARTVGHRDGARFRLQAGG
ncbi:MAG: hypothetical protein R3C97_17445 [Geminicoccaceae bacterium]